MSESQLNRLAKGAAAPEGSRLFVAFARKLR